MAIPKQVEADQSAIDQALAKADGLLEQLQAELADADTSSLTCLRQQRQQIVDGLERRALTAAIVGGRATGKTKLLAALETAGLDLTTAEADPDAPEADLLLLTVAADMTASELAHLEALITAGHQVLVVFNKTDQYVPMDRAVVLERIRSRVQERGAELVAIAANPNPVKVRRHGENGEVTEFMEQPQADLAALTAELTAAIAAPAAYVRATALRQVRQLQRQTVDQLNQLRRQRAMPLIEQMQWIAAGTAFANPLASLDLLAAAAINAQLVMDLGKLYGQGLSMDQAKAAAGTIAQLTVKLGLVELTSQALGSILKTHAATYVAGGAIQGVSAAYLTRLAGLSLIDYFESHSLEEDSSLNFEHLGDRLQAIFKQARQGLALKDFALQALGHLPKVARPA